MSALEPKFRALLGNELSGELELFLDEWGWRIDLERELTNGMSGGRTFVIFVTSTAEPPTKLILKIVSSDLERPAEDDAHHSAQSQMNLERHIVTLNRVASLTGFKALFINLAGAGFSSFRTLTDYVHNVKIVSLVQTVLHRSMSAVLSQAQIQSRSLPSLLEEHWGRKAEPGGALARWLVDRSGPKILSASHIIFGEDESRTVVVNPITLGKQLFDVRYQTIVAPGHGDLHLDNIIIPIVKNAPAADEFMLIDFAHFSAEMSWTLDAATLTSTVLAASLPRYTAKARRDLLQHFAEALGGKDVAEPALRAIHVVDRDAETLAADRGLADEMHFQFRLSLGAKLCELASRSRFDEPDRMWLLEAGSRTLDAIVKVSQGEIADLGITVDAQRRVAREVADQVTRFTSSFSMASANIAVLGTNVTAESAACLTKNGWDLIIDFDRNSQLGGALSKCAGVAPLRIVQAGQETTFGSGLTVWLAARGLALHPGDDGHTFRQWRRLELKAIKQLLDSLAAAREAPFTMTIFGDPDHWSDAVIDAVVDSYGDRLDILQVDDSPDVTNHLDITTIAADCSLVIDYLPRRQLTGSLETMPTIPAGVGGERRLELSAKELAWYSAVGDLLHSGIASGQGELDRDEFYYGAPISWAELEEDLDVPRTQQEVFYELVRKNLADRGTRRIPLYHLAGAGGSTLARRIAWNIRDAYPVLVGSDRARPDEIADRVRQLARDTERSVLLVLESISDSFVGQVFDRLRAGLVNASILIVARRRRKDNLREVVWLGPLDAHERDAFVRLFGILRPERRHELRTLTRDGHGMSVPFIYALTALEREFRGVSDFVRRSLDGCDDKTIDVLRIVALVHHYAGTAIPAQILGSVLGAPPNRPVTLLQHLSDASGDLLIEDEHGKWKTRHNLIAEEILSQFARSESSIASTSRASWNAFLSSWSCHLIEAVYDTYEDQVPMSVLNMLDALFLRREDRDALASVRDDFSVLLTDIRSLNGRIQVLKFLAETFPDQAHYWAHYARLLSYQAKDHPAAREAIEKALELDPDDSILLHVSGMLYSREAFSLISECPPRSKLTREFEESVIRLAGEALVEFADSADRYPSNAYAQVGSVRLCVKMIEWRLPHSGASTYAEMLSQPSLSFYADLLARAEESLEELDIIRADDQRSDMEERVRLEVRALYDDFGALISGWRAMLDREGTDRVAVRSRIVRLYGQQAGGWRMAGTAVRKSAIALLEKNLRDDPKDSVSLKEWLRLARYESGSLDRAAELVGYWAEESGEQAALFYDYVVNAVLALRGRDSAVRPFQLKVARCRDAAKAFPNRTSVFEWYATGDELGALLHTRDLNWERGADDAQSPVELVRVRARIKRIEGPASGVLDIASGVTAFFTPSRGGFVRDRDENLTVTCVIGFSYEGLRAWNVVAVPTF